MVGHGGAGKMRSLRDCAHAYAIALADSDHFDNQMLTIFVTERQQDFPACSKFVRKALDVLLMQVVGCDALSIA